MAKLECPICGSTFTKSLLNAWTEDICSNCYRNPERRQDFSTSKIKPGRSVQGNKIASFETDLSELNDAAEEVIKFSRVFKRIGDVLNTINYIATGVLVIFVVIAISSKQIQGLYILAAGILILVLWAIAWIQTGFLRGLSAFFLMKGLKQKTDLE
jgi:membrane glycosyltransferase